MDVLGQRIEHDFGKNVGLQGGLSLWQVARDHVIAEELNTGGESHAFELYFETEEIEALRDTLRGGKVEFLHDVQEEAWGQRTLRFFDPDGHLVEVGEPIEVFVRHMFERGLSRPAIAETSGIPLSTIERLLEGLEF